MHIKLWLVLPSLRIRKHVMLLILVFTQQKTRCILIVMTTAKWRMRHFIFHRTKVQILSLPDTILLQPCECWYLLQEMQIFYSNVFTAVFGKLFWYCSLPSYNLNTMYDVPFCFLVPFDMSWSQTYLMN